jgi:hypothetical protein
LSTLPQPPLAPNAIGDEFVGPFITWADLKRHYGAIGDGVTDDTGAIQSALNASNAILRDFHIHAASATGIEVQNADQQNSRVYMQQVNATRATSANIFVRRS